MSQKLSISPKINFAFAKIFKAVFCEIPFHYKFYEMLFCKARNFVIQNFCNFALSNTGISRNFLDNYLAGVPRSGGGGGAIWEEFRMPQNLVIT